MGLEARLGFENTDDEVPITLCVGVKNTFKGSDRGPLRGVYAGIDNLVSGEVRGVLAGVQSLAENIVGAHVGGQCTTDGKMGGFQGGVLSDARDLKGMHAGVIVLGQVMRGLAIGFCTVFTDMYAGLKIGAANFSNETNGVDLGAIFSTCGYGKGVRAAPIDVVTDEFDGLQVGGVVYAKEGSYLQIGLLTIRGGPGPWYKRISPFVGFRKRQMFD